MLRHATPKTHKFTTLLRHHVPKRIIITPSKRQTLTINTLTTLKHPKSTPCISKITNIYSNTPTISPNPNTTIITNSIIYKYHHYVVICTEYRHCK